MMLGRDESMPNVVREPDLTSEEREYARFVAERHTKEYAGSHSGRDCVACVMARAVLRYVPAGVPESAPHPVAAADDQTRPATVEVNGVDCRVAGVVWMDVLPRCDECDPSFGCFNGLGGGLARSIACQKRPLEAGVICEPIAPEPSDGICEVSDDASTAAAKLDFTAAYDPSVHGEITRK